MSISIRKVQYTSAHTLPPPQKKQKGQEKSVRKNVEWAANIITVEVDVHQEHDTKEQKRSETKTQKPSVPLFLLGQMSLCERLPRLHLPFGDVHRWQGFRRRWCIADWEKGRSRDFARFRAIWLTGDKKKTNVIRCQRHSLQPCVLLCVYLLIWFYSFV